MLTRNHVNYLFGAFISLSLLTSCSSANQPQNAENNNAKPTQTVAVNSVEKPTEKAEVQKQNEPVKIFDGRKDLGSREYSKEETSRVQAEFDRKKSEIKNKFGDKYCYEPEEEKIGLNGIAEGAFTKPNAKQKAFLYTLCSSGSSHFGVGGIIVFENDKAVSHYVYGENGLDQGMIVLPDINKDGRDELVLLDFQVHQGYGGGTISLVEFPDGNFNFIGSASIYSDDSGAAEDEKDTKANAYDIFAQPAANPVFYRDSYEKKGNAKNWSLVKKGEKFLLTKLEPEIMQGYKKISL